MSRKALPPERRRHTRITVNVTDDVADAVCNYAQRHREKSVSTAIAKLLERLARREQELGFAVDCRIQTP